jgi:tRNA nucleotidyltransferase (CCA-adding enzyme)
MARGRRVDVLGRLPGLDAVHAALAEVAPATPVYLVGGAVRDALAGVPHGPDLDLVVEGEAGHLARLLARALEGRAVVHRAFGTATVATPAVTFDLATARRERYAAPGALPVVEPATLADDLARRDFTVNAMAVALAGPDAGALRDPFGGSRDLRARRLRTLHDASFRDDATRILRAARYEARLGFHLLRADERRARAALRDGMLDRISGARLRAALALVCDEPQAALALARLGELGALAAIDAALAVPADLATAIAGFDALRAGHAPAASGWSARLGLLARGLAADRCAALVERLRLGRHDAAVLRHVAGRAPHLAERLAVPLAPSSLVAALEREPVEAILAAGALGDDTARAQVVRYLDELREVRLAVRGDELARALGVQPGPHLGRVIHRVLQRKLDGELETPEAELAAAREALAELR